MRLLLICFSLVLQLRAASVSGLVVLDHGSKSKSDIVVWLQLIGGHPVEAAFGVHRTLLQKNKMFHPHVLPVEVGTVVDFPNADPIFHNAFSNYDGQIFDVSLYPPGTSRSVVFRHPGIVRVFCNIHPMMSAVILVLPTPFFAHVDENGAYRFDNVPAGLYELDTFDERATPNRSSEAISVRDADEKISLSAIRISEAGYIPPTHKNKYGQDYPIDSDPSPYGTVPQ